jgi:hypothetical protein
VEVEHTYEVDKNKNASAYDIACSAEIPSMEFIVSCEGVN